MQILDHGDMCGSNVTQLLHWEELNDIMVALTKHEVIICTDSLNQ